LWWFGKQNEVLGHKSHQPFLTGIALGVGASLCLMTVYGHTSIYVKFLQILFFDTNELDSNHSFQELASVYGRHLFFALASAILALSTYYCLLRLKITRYLNDDFVIVPLAILAGVVLQFRRIGDFFIPGLLLLWVTYNFYISFKNNSLSSKNLFVISLATLCMFLLPIGSNNGILNAFISSGPLFCLYFISNYGVTNEMSWLKGHEIFHKSILVTVCSFVVISHSQFIYRDGPDRLSLVTPSENFPGLFTTEKRDKSFTLVKQVHRHTMEACRNILVIGDAPLIHYLTKTIPALAHPWPFLMTQVDFENALKEQVPKFYPPVVMPAFSTVEGFFPESKEPRDNGWEQLFKREVAHRTLVQLGYSKVEITTSDYPLIKQIRRDQKSPYEVFMHPQGCQYGDTTY
jgi:hypothetical protein